MCCKELEERQTQENINLGFNAFCENSKIRNYQFAYKVLYISLQYNIFFTTGCFLSEIDANVIITQTLTELKQTGKMDILNRQDDFVFKG